MNEQTQIMFASIGCVLICTILFVAPLFIRDTRINCPVPECKTVTETMNGEEIKYMYCFSEVSDEQ